jgi:hypothetical protein
VQVAKENIPEVAPVKEEVFVTASVDPVSVTTPELPLSEEVVTVDTANPTPTGNDQRYTLTDGRINTSQLARTRIRWVNEFRKKE